MVNISIALDALLVHNADMLNAEDIKTWLKEIGKDRAWLAEKTLVSKRTVDNWLSAGKPIVPQKMELIEKLMSGEEEIEFELPPDFEKQLRAMADEAKKTIEDMVSHILQVTAKAHQKRKAEAPSQQFTPVETFTTPPLEAQGRIIGNIAAGNLAIRYGIHGACINVVTACATGAHNIGEAVRAIRHGYADAALVGGSEESVSPICIAGFTNLGALSRAEDPTQASLPFDVRRKGFVAGEGAGALVIESLEHALKRGATPIAEITGYGSTGDAYHMTAPDPEGAGIVRSMRQALEEGGFTPADIGHVNAHGTGTPANDKTESIALYALCDDDELAAGIPVTSIKGTTGHTLGAAGAVEAIVCALSVARDCVPPTTGFAEADPECAVNVVTEALTDVPQKVALSNSLGFGGHNATLAFSPYE